MKLFSCPHCGFRLYFENARCLNCGSLVLYDPDRAVFVLAGGRSAACRNAEACGCNWVAGEGFTFCWACLLNKTIPALSVPGNRDRWIRVERAKKRAIYSLLRFALPVGAKAGEDDEIGLAFDLLAPVPGAVPGGEPILTGHDKGLITLNVNEADSAEREKMRVAMGETYRTLLGHFRHELGHYYWDRLIRDDAEWLGQFREIFGDDQADYEEALKRHYAQGSPPDWQVRHISPYAASHAWEDWAESWAHYLHITDTLEMVQALALRIGDHDRLDKDSTDESFDRLLERWLALSEASNSINRCMGLPDLYPFVVSPGAARKLRFVHDLLGRPDLASRAEGRPAISFS